MAVSRQEIREIKAGRSKTFKCGSPLECRSAQSTASQVARLYKPEGIEKYQTCIDFDACTITITAVPRKEEYR